MKKSWIILAILLLAALGFASAVADDTTDPAAYQPGNTVFFGSWEQDNQRNGSEPIEWLVLDVKDGKALLLSKYGLDQVLNKDSSRTLDSWEHSVLREWLSDSFFPAAFSEAEQPAVILTEVDNSTAQGYQGKLQAYGGKSVQPKDEANTRDRVFLLSCYELDLYLPEEEDRKCEATPYALANDKNGEVNADGFGYWFLRSPGYYGKYDTLRALVSPEGSLYLGIIDCYLLVRPALWVDLNAIAPWECPSCGKENEFDSAFCPWCGARKPEASPVICSGCGAEYPADTEYMFCRKCGTKLEKSEDAKPEETKPENEPSEPADLLQGTWVLKDVTGTDQQLVDTLKGQMMAGYEQQMVFSGNQLTVHARLEYQETTITGTFTADGNTIYAIMDTEPKDETMNYHLKNNWLEILFDGYTLVFMKY